MTEEQRKKFEGIIEPFASVSFQKKHECWGLETGVIEQIMKAAYNLGLEDAAKLDVCLASRQRNGATCVPNCHCEKFPQLVDRDSIIKLKIQ